MNTLVLAVTGTSGVYAAELLAARSPWPVSLVLSNWGKRVYESECGSLERLTRRVCRVWADDELDAPIASGSVPTRGMVVLPCSCNVLAKVAVGLADSLVARAAHCHLKERRRLVLCVREAPWTLMTAENAVKVITAGGVVMPLSPPFYMLGDTPPDQATVHDLLVAYVDRVLAVLGQPAPVTWEDLS